MTTSTILLKKDIIDKLKQIREYPKQTYNELIEHMSTVFIAVKKKNTYDEFLHKIQQPKMKELWGNREDEAWESV